MKPIVFTCVLCTLTGPLRAQEVPWAEYGRDPLGTRYSPAAVIDRTNVTDLEHAWTYRTGEADPRFATVKETSFQTTPIVSDGTMYFSTPLGRVIALDAATGRELWAFDPGVPRDGSAGSLRSRGVALWIDHRAGSDAPCRRTIFSANAQAQLVALDARDGRLCAGFGSDGVINLTDGLRIPPFEPGAYSVTSPPVVVGDLVITGSASDDNTQPDLPSGEVRAFDARTGALAWSWDPIPQNPADPAYGDWRGDLAHGSGGGNAWTILASDPERDLLFIPTGSPSPDYYGVLRLGANRYANSLVALQASTGRLVWSFQTVHHDLWDYDNASPPALVTLVRDGIDVPAVLLATKTGMLFVFHRETGEPLFPIEERAVPASAIPGEEASPTQPFSGIALLSPHGLALDDVWGVDDADLAACLGLVRPLRNEGIFTPPDTRGTLVIPSNIGGAHWGGLAWDPERQIAVIPVNRVAAEVQLIPRDSVDLAAARAESARLGLGYEYNVMRGTPYIMRRRILMAPSGLPCSPPPFGTLVAVDLTSGAHLWEVPLGSFERLVPPGAELPPDWGSVNLGGPIATAGGLVFIGAAMDRAIKAYDIETGRELWRGALPESGRATPMTYRLASGDQYVVIAVGGGDEFGRGDHVVAFRLSP